MKGTRTEENLLKAYLGESQTRNKYLFYAKIAKKEGFEQIGGIFEDTANHELSHAKNFLKHLNTDDDIEVCMKISGRGLKTTKENLLTSIESEHLEWTKTYLEFANIAREEGFLKIEALFRSISKAEEAHETRFARVLKRLDEGKWFTRDEEVSWMCRKCGYIHKGNRPPKLCPACYHPEAYFEVEASTY